MDNRQEVVSAGTHRGQHLLLFSVFAIATCGLIYELVAGTLASYLLGDSVTQFSTIIGTYLFSMGIGSWLSRYFEEPLLRWFVMIEILVGLVGGCSAPLLFLTFEYVSSFRIVLYALVCLTGILVGLEIPILMRMLKGNLAFKDLVARVFTFDYIGALLASLIFPLVMVPHLGLVRSALLFGMINVAIAAIVLFRFEAARTFRRPFLVAILLSLVLLGSGFAASDRIMNFAETLSFQDRIIYAKQTPYQRMVLTRSSRELRLWLNGNLQFSSADEYRYHEALVHPGLHALPGARSVLILGGGDGLAAREVLRYPNVSSITLVDLDPAMTRLFRSHPMLTALNKGALSDARVRVINNDAFSWAKANREKFDFIIVDFPDPSNYSIGKLYSSKFYDELQHCLSDSGIIVVQSTSPYVARKSFWCVAHTLSAAGFITVPYHVYVPSFGEWGYVMGMRRYQWRADYPYPPHLRFVTQRTVQDMFSFPPDMAEVPTDINRLNNQVLVNYFEHEWAPYSH